MVNVQILRIPVPRISDSGSELSGRWRRAPKSVASVRRSTHSGV